MKTSVYWELARLRVRINLAKGRGDQEEVKKYTRLKEELEIKIRLKEVTLCP